MITTSGIDVIAYLLQMDSKALQNALRIKTLSMGNKGEEVKKPLTVPEVRTLPAALHARHQQTRFRTHIAVGLVFT
jgi:hypothetical protein